MANRRSEAGSAQKTETLEISAAQEELSILDKLANALSAIISDLTRQRPQFDRRNEHTEVALHERKYSSLKGYQELAHHCYGRTVIGKEVDERGRPTSQFSYRITQANVGHVDDGCVVLARNSPIASKLVTANPGDESEISLPKRMRFLRTDEVRLLDGPVSLLSPNQKPNFRSMMIRLARAKKPITVQNLRAFVNASAYEPTIQEITPASALPDLTIGDPRAAPAPEDRPTSALDVDPTWFSRWQTVYLGDAETASLGHQFFTRTTPRQETALNNPRGLTFVEGIAGAGRRRLRLGALSSLQTLARENSLSTTDSSTLR